MSVSSTDRKAFFTLDGVTTDFDFTFPALDEEDIKGIANDTDLTYGVDYTVSLTDTGGTVTLTTPGSYTAGTLTIYRETTDKQESEYNDYNKFPASTVETDLDRAIMLIQELGEEVDRALKNDITETDPITWDDVEEAVTAAEDAQTAAEAAQTLAETAQTAAETAQGLAEYAQAAAEAAAAKVPDITTGDALKILRVKYDESGNEYILYSGAVSSRPSSPIIGDWFISVDEGKIYYCAVEGAWVEYTGADIFWKKSTIAIKTDDYSVTTDDFGKCLIMNASSAKAFTLPSVGETNDGYLLSLKSIGTGLTTITPADSDTVEVATLFTDESVILIYDHANTKWRAISHKVADISFRAYLGTTQALSASTWTKVTLNTEDYDTGAFDHATNYRFTAPKAGKYQFNGSIYFASFSDGELIKVRLYKNGSAVSESMTRLGNNDNNSATISDVLSLAATDYVELYAWASGTPSLTGQDSGCLQTYLSGALIK